MLFYGGLEQLVHMRHDFPDGQWHTAVSNYIRITSAISYSSHALTECEPAVCLLVVLL